MALEFLYQQQH